MRNRFLSETLLKNFFQKFLKNFLSSLFFFQKISLLSSLLNFKTPKRSLPAPEHARSASFFLS
jgi:hypothetical protein